MDATLRGDVLSEEARRFERGLLIGAVHRGRSKPKTLSMSKERTEVMAYGGMQWLAGSSLWPRSGSYVAIPGTTDHPAPAHGERERVRLAVEGTGSAFAQARPTRVRRNDFQVIYCGYMGIFLSEPVPLNICTCHTPYWFLGQLSLARGCQR